MCLQEHEEIWRHNSSGRVWKYGFIEQLVAEWPVAPTAVCRRFNFSDVWKQREVAVGIFVAVGKTDAYAVRLKTLYVIIRRV